MNTPVTEEELFELIKKYSFFNENDYDKFYRYKQIAPRQFYFWFFKDLPNRCVITLQKSSIIIAKKNILLKAERQLYHNLIGTLKKINGLQLSKHDIDNILALTQLKSIIKSFKFKKNFNPTSFLLTHIKKMEEWASQTYENQGISFCLGIETSQESLNIINLKDLYNDPICKVMTSGLTTMLVCDYIGNIISYEERSNFPQKQFLQDKCVSPYIFEWLAKWTEQANRVVIHLNARGEILLFYQGTLAFAKRNSKWCLVHSSQFEHWIAESSNFNTKFKKSLTDTFIDVSFKRTGGCIGILENEKLLQNLTTSQDILQTDVPNNKTLFFNHLILNKKFQELPRELRQELIAVDGATILDKEGKILAVGAILNLNNDFPTEERRHGGRSTAAKQLAHYGIGIKISADGGITAWQKDKDNPDKIKKIFELF